MSDKIDWFAIGAGPELAATLRPQVLAPLETLAFDRAVLDRKWELDRRELEQAAEWGKLPDPGSEFIYSPHLGVLKERIIRSWSLLADPLVLSSCVGLINKMRSSVGATLYGYAILASALLEAGHHENAEHIADLQARYLKELGFTPGAESAETEPAAEPDGATE